MSEAPEERPPAHRAEQPTPPSGPRPVFVAFAAVFIVMMVFNILYDALHDAYHGEKLTMFLGFAALLTLGVDVGKMIGRR